MKLATKREQSGAFATRALRHAALALTLLLSASAVPVLAREGVDVGGNSAFTKLVPAEQVERAASQQYLQMLTQADSKRALAPKDHAQLVRLRAIAKKIIPFAIDWNPRARDWKWEVNLIGSSQINAFCMPGGKIAFYTGILDKLQLTEDEIAMVMGHEIAHALREHARERMAKGAATQGVLRLTGALVAGYFGIDSRITDAAAGGLANLTSLVFSREDESEADLVGMELAARAGFDPRSGVTLWQKMGAANKGAPPQWLSTHPSGSSRIADIQANLPKVMPLFERARAR
jgi:predicted Zn-dependent protease